MDKEKRKRKRKRKRREKCHKLHRPQGKPKNVINFRPSHGYFQCRDQHFSCWARGVVSCRVVSRRVVSCCVASCRVVSRRVVLRRVASCRVASPRFVSCRRRRLASCPVASRRVASRGAVSWRRRRVVSRQVGSGIGRGTRTFRFHYSRTKDCHFFAPPLSPPRLLTRCFFPQSFPEPRPRRGGFPTAYYIVLYF